MQSKIPNEYIWLLFNKVSREIKTVRDGKSIKEQKIVIKLHIPTKNIYTL